MELEFDKEIDAILRKARGSTGAGVNTANGTHPDADTIAAFAENALPQKTKLLYMKHFADCDRCRKQLSQMAMMNTEADAAAASPVSAPVAEVTLPWYQRLFTTQGLAVAMGALVLTLGAGLVYLMIQNSTDANNVSVSQVTEQEAPRSAPAFGGDADISADTNANTANALTSNSAANIAGLPQSGQIAVNASEVGAGTGLGSTAANTTLGASRAQPEDERKTAVTDSVTGAEPPRPAAPPPPPVSLDVSEGEDGKKDADGAKGEAKKLELSKRRETDDQRGYRRDAPPAAAKAGPARAGPLQSQSNQVNNQSFEMPVTRRVGGKSFNNRDGAWYDTAYRGQATINYRRSSVDYKQLDPAARNIADTIGGTVVIVWKGKAYRIQ
jgi:hypothetical protein